MKTRKTNIIMQNKNIIRIVVATAFILLVPLLAMLFTDEVEWDLTDFAIIGTLLIGAGLIFELVTTKLNTKYRVVVAVVFVATLLLVWAELAVGVLNTPFSGS